METGSRRRRDRDVDSPSRRGRGDVVAATWISSVETRSRRRRGRDLDIPWRQVAATPQPTWIFRGDEVAATPRPRRGISVETRRASQVRRHGARLRRARAAARARDARVQGQTDGRRDASEIRRRRKALVRAPQGARFYGVCTRVRPPDGQGFGEVRRPSGQLEDGGAAIGFSHAAPAASPLGISTRRPRWGRDPPPTRGDRRFRSFCGWCRPLEGRL